MPYTHSTRCSLAAALQAARDGGQVSSDRLARLAAAVRCFSRLAKAEPEALPAERRFIVERFQKLRRSVTGLSPKSLANAKSELLHLVGITAPPRPARVLTAAWLDLRTAIGGGNDWWALTRLAAFASATDLEPAALTADDFDRFEAALEASGELPSARAHRRRAQNTINRIAEQCPDLKLRPAPVPAPLPRPRWSLPLERFPSNFQADLAGWIEHLGRDADPLSDAEHRRALRPATIRHRQVQLQHAASALVLSGMPIEQVTGLDVLVQIENFQALMRHLLQRRGDQPSEALHGLAGALLAVARHWVKVDRVDAQRLARLVANLDVPVAGFRSKTRTRLEAFEDPRIHGALLHLPRRLLAEARSATSDRRRRHAAQMALAIEILTFAPLRLANLAQLRLGESFREVRQARGSRWLARFEPQTVKNRATLAFELPAESSSLVAEALRHSPPVDGWLFPGQSGAKGASCLGTQIKRTVERHVGVPFNVHLFRALAGLTHLRDNPDGFESVRALLGDRDDRVVREHYAFAAERHLIDHAQRSISRSRARLSPPPARRRG